MQPETLQQDLAEFIAYRHNLLKGDEKGEAQVFLDRLFKAFGNGGVREAGATLEARVRKAETKGTSFADLLWESRCIIEMKKAGTDLSKHFRQAFQYWIQVVPHRPNYVVLCNFDEFWVYDFDLQLDAPMDVLKLDDLVNRREVLAFLLPEPETPLFGNDLVQVTREAAAQVSSVFRSMKDRGVPRLDAQHFVLQSVVAMFAEDIGLLPEKFFTRVVEEAKSGRDAYDLLGSLFREMNTPGRTKGGQFVGTPYFNGGIFENITPIEMNRDELNAIRWACTTNWAAVRPEIFGTLFETSMDKDERHAYGAHFTSQADIARVVIPCIVDPWMERIEAAKTIGDLEQIQLAMASYRVLDPACGSGNFLYVAYREMRRLEVEVKNRIAARRRTKSGQATISYVTPDHFMGIDTNAFAVEVAKVTMMMAKKLAADELEEYVDALPLDNLDESIRCRDALFSEWPSADVLIGNPPYLGRRKMAAELGADYVSDLDGKYPNPGVSDFVTYWFPLAHKALPQGGRAGFVATQAVRDGDSRKASLDYVVKNDGVIFEAVSVTPWSGDAVVHVSIVNWVKGANHAPAKKVLWLNNGQLRLEVEDIAASLRPVTDVGTAASLPQNKAPKRIFQGQTTGKIDAFRLTGGEAADLGKTDPGSAAFIHPVLGGKVLLHSLGPQNFIIDLPHDDALDVKVAAPGALARLRKLVLPDREAAAEKEATANAAILKRNSKAQVRWHNKNFLNKWWQHSYRRCDMIEAFAPLQRYIATSRVAAEQRVSVFQFVDTSIRPDDSMTVIAFDDDYTLGVVSSALHRAWFEERCSKLKSDLRYTSTTVWDSFPWPTSPGEAVAEVAQAMAAIIDYREAKLAKGITLGEQYDALRTPGKSELRALHDVLDAAVVRAYGFNPEEDLLAQLLALNLAAASDPEAAIAPGGGGRPEAYTTTYRLTAAAP
ncbi:DNA methyltransferase [Mycobacterium sp. ST-F2]|uniref:class I SAM-dependent DNA methyltransferase n=1 Tax=Mycobacterium sp. ST-F2 TaxID=1490484 RepID=UPI00093F0088|nr:DNA methyltransferase [Mycobacterium sp. ST-F2]OKH80883.1 DNA methyltransferase [Mycobacterium sp. ST-F2]